jgi:hypothetical protein
MADYIFAATWTMSGYAQVGRKRKASSMMTWHWHAFFDHQSVNCKLQKVLSKKAL